MSVFVFVPPHAPLCLHILLHGLYVREHVHTFLGVWVGTAAAYSLRLPAPPHWWLTAAISFLSEWVYNPCYNAVIIQFAYICLASTKHMWSQSYSSAPAVYLISLYHNITQDPLVAAFIRRAFTAQTRQHRTPIPGSVRATLCLFDLCHFHSFGLMSEKLTRTNYCSRK